MAVIPFQQPVRTNNDPPEQQFRQAVERAGLTSPSDVRMNGKINRFHTGSGKKHDKSGWYILFGDGVPAGAFGDWKEEYSYTWRAEISRELSPEEEQTIRENIRKAREIREAELARSQTMAAATVKKIWEGASDATENHPYLTRKGVKNHGLKMTNGDRRLIIPVYNSTGEMVSLQYIDKEGNKQFHPGGKVSGCFFMISGEGSKIYMAEGYATAATIHEVTGASVIIGYNANNLIPVAQSIRQTYPNNPLVIVGDNDESGTGQKCAKEAADRSGATVIIPPELGDANDYHMAGHDLKELLEGTDKPDWLIPVSEFVKKPAPIKWLIKGWVQANACMMMFGPSGSGKTFVAIDMALRIASDMDDWQDNRVRHGGVIYLAGEGHYGLKARIAGWLSYFGVASKTLSLWVSRDGCDLNTAEGYRRTVDNISKTGMPVSLIVIDTLHRFLQGDENSAQDAKTMLDACSRLMREFDCSVLLVHHTGVAQEAQKRARGSSAWKGAQDIEISVCNKGGGAITVEQTKSKDTELAQPIQLQQKEIDVPGWIDEDGDQVTTVVLRAREEETDMEPKKKLPESLNFAMNTYREAAYKKGRLTSKGFSGVHLEEWREVYYERSPQDNSTAKRQAFLRGRDGLVKKGILIASNDFYRPTDEIEVSTIVLYLKENRGQI